MKKKQKNLQYLSSSLSFEIVQQSLRRTKNYELPLLKKKKML